MSGSCSRRHQRDLVSAMQLLVIPLIFFYCFLWLPQHFQAAPMPPPPSSPSSWTDKKNTDATHKWQKLAKAHITRHFSGNPRAQPVAKNVILFIGDGMGLTTVTAARIFKSQFKAQQSSENFQDEEEIKSEEPEWTQSAEEDELSFEKFEHVALSKTYNLDSQVGESGACATALMSGVKANFETIGLSGLAKHNNCTSTFVEGGRVSSIAEWAQQQGKSTGFVTTTRVTHATPAAFYAHAANRYWESDDKVPKEARSLCKDIARQLIEDEPGRNLNVIMGGGSRHFEPRSADNPAGKRSDGRNLTAAWLEDKRRRGLHGSVVANRRQLMQLNSSKVDYLLGLFSSNHLAHEADRDKSDYGEPSLAEMTLAAVQVLKHNPNGFLLVVESGRIDHAHHQNNAYRALTDTLALEAAVEQVLAAVNRSTTLLLVTADHSHVLTLGGSFPGRGNPILGLDASLSDVDGLPYTTLLYANGPGYVTPANRSATNYSGTEKSEYIQQAAVPRRWATHGGEDVPVYASGAGAAVFTGVLDQTFIPFGIAYAACMGPMRKVCEEHREEASKERMMMMMTAGDCETKRATAVSARSRSSSVNHEESQVKGLRRLHSSAPVDSELQQQQKEATSSSLLDFIRYHWELSSASSTSSSSSTSQLTVSLTLVYLLVRLFCWLSSIY